MRLRIGLVVAALAILALGAWFAVREPTLPRSASFAYLPIDSGGFPVYDQLPLRIAIAMVSSSVATALIIFAARRRGANGGPSPAARLP
jgi:hypothetical protein